MLAPYRVLDLADEKGLFCGKLLGDMGADVVKIEKPGGDAARRIGPFVHDDAGPERSLYWFARNTNKRSITLDIEKAEGREVLGELVKTADFVIESSPPGYMESLGLGYSSLEAINPGIIVVSISPFGQTGPYRDYKTPDIVSWAMGGYMFPWDNADHPPIRISHHAQACLHASGEGAAGAMMALYHRNLTGEGQHVDVSIHESIVHSAFLLFVSWDLNKTLWNRSTQGRPAAALPQMWPCKDGYVIFMFFGGERAPERNGPLIRWMEEAGMGDDALSSFDWLSLDMTQITEEQSRTIETPARRFFLANTKAELLEGSLKYGVMLYPVSDTADLMASTQLRDRGFWVDIEHPELGRSITYPGPFARASETPPGISRRAPLIGEHNEQILRDELGLSQDRLDSLRKAGVIQ
jgi:crotonobetainyl-CoA:carnitine CoA-transferase CaiB-like acyl-CoA transferase